QVLENPLEKHLPGLDQHVFNRAKLLRALLEVLDGSGIQAAGVDRHGDDRPAQLLLHPRHQERGVEPAREAQDDRRLRVLLGCHHSLQAPGSLPAPLLNRARSLATSRFWSPPLPVAMNMVSSPDTVPTISGQPERSSARATCWA